MSSRGGVKRAAARGEGSTAATGGDGGWSRGRSRAPGGLGGGRST